MTGAEEATNPLGFKTRKSLLGSALAFSTLLGIVAGGVSWLSNKTHVPREEFVAEKESARAEHAAIRQQMAVQAASSQLTSNQLRSDVADVKTGQRELNARLEELRIEIIREVRRRR